MTKAQLVDRLVRDPIVIEPVAHLGWHRIALHGDTNTANGVVIALVPARGALIVDEEDYGYARIDGKVEPLTRAETERVAARLRRVFARTA